jgi:hypothetical protein
VQRLRFADRLEYAIFALLEESRNESRFASSVE